MAWDHKRGTFVCDRCRTFIGMSTRQDKFLGKKGEGKKAGDPYVSVSWVAFFEPEKENRSYNKSTIYCWDCEKDFIKVIEKFNKRTSIKRKVGGDSPRVFTRTSLLLDVRLRKKSKRIARKYFPSACSYGQKGNQVDER